jgi:acyl dehydratase
LHYSELPSHVDEVLGPTEWLALDATRVAAFAMATGDFDDRHIPPPESPASNAGVVHTYLLLPVLLMALRELLAIDGVDESFNYGLDRVRFPALARVGSPLRAQAILRNTLDVDRGLQITLDATLLSAETTKPVCIATVLHRLWTPQGRTPVAGAPTDAKEGMK